MPREIITLGRRLIKEQNVYCSSPSQWAVSLIDEMEDGTPIHCYWRVFDTEAKADEYLDEIKREYGGVE